MILLDTSVVSAVFRRRTRGEAEEALAARVGALLRSDQQVGLPGIVLQEVLSGIAENTHLQKLLAALRAGFPVILATEGDHLLAADVVNLGGRRGLSVSTPDALIAAQAINRHASLFTSDADFGRLAWSGLKLL